MTHTGQTVQCGELLIRTSDGYVNATRMCKSSNKLFAHYYRTDTCKRFLYVLSNQLGVADKDLIMATRGGHTQGTWVHPRVATHLACWVSTQFMVQVTGWLEDARHTIPHIDTQYTSALDNLQPDENDQQEARIRDTLAEELQGKTEVPAMYGAIDIVTENQVIEVKHIDRYVHALGQVLAHSEQFPRKQRRIHLFGPDEDMTYTKLALARVLYQKYNITTSFEFITGLSAS